MSFCAFSQLVPIFIFFSAWDKSRVKWDNFRKSTQKMWTKEIIIWLPEHRQDNRDFSGNPAILVDLEQNIKWTTARKLTSGKCFASYDDRLRTSFEMDGTTDYGRPMKPFFIKIQKVWAWADKFWGIWGIFSQTISTHFGTEGPYFPLFNQNFYNNLSLYILIPHSLLELHI